MVVVVVVVAMRRAEPELTSYQSRTKQRVYPTTTTIKSNRELTSMKGSELLIKDRKMMERRKKDRNKEV